MAEQHQNEVNEIRAELLPRTGNLLALVAQHKPIYRPQNHPTNYTHNSSSRQQQATTRNRGKAIVTSSTLIYDQAPIMKIYKPTNNNLRNSSNTSRANQDNTPKINRGTGHVARECQKSKRVKDAAYHKEKMLLYIVENSRPVFNEPLQKVQNDDDNYNVFANDKEHPEQPESINDTYSMDMSTSGGEVDHDDDDDDDLARERDLLASLIEKLKCEIDDNKNRNKFLETSNKTLVDKLKSEIEDFKNKNKSLESSNNHFKEANNELSKTNQLMFKDIKKFQDELDRYHDVNYASKVELDCAKAKRELIAYKMSLEKSFNEYTRMINELIQTISDMKRDLVAHQEKLSIISQEKEAQKQFYKTREDK
ncbi:hypothetical protein Tco_1250360 [Tanacetum coccineum]